MNQFQVHCSYTSFHFAYNELGEPEAICFPENYLGKNYKKVLAFWFRIDKFTDDQMKTMDQRRKQKNPDWNYWRKCCDELLEIEGDEFDDENNENYLSEAYWSPIRVHDPILAEGAHYFLELMELGAATLEIIHGVENPVFLPLFDGLLAPPETEAIIEAFLSSDKE